MSGWQVYSNSNIYPNPDPSQIHGDPGEYAAAPAIPSQTDPGWVDCGPSAPLRYSPYTAPASMCPNPSTIDMHVGSILSSCWSNLNFTSFQALVSIPAGTTISTFSVDMNGADDGARISLVNSLYPTGVTPTGGYIYQLTTQSTGNLANYVAAGEVNRVVITQVDDCPTGNNLNSAQILLNGTVIPVQQPQSITASATPTSTSWNNTSTIASSGYSGTGAVTYSVDNGSNGNTSLTGCSLSGTTLSAPGSGTCYVYAQIAADANYTSATSSDVAVSFTPVSQSISASATPTSTSAGNTSTLSASGFSGTGGVTYAVDNGSNGNTSASSCSLSGTTLSANGSVTCYVYATIGADVNYSSATSADIAVAFTDTDLAIGSTANITTAATSPSGAVVNYSAPSATDESGESPTVTCNDPSGSTFPVGTTTVTCTATDSDDTPSSISTSFTVTVTDTDLTIGSASNITTAATSPSGAVVNYSAPSATDESGENPGVVCDHQSGSTFAIGTTTVTCTATDSDDTPSSVSVSFTVHVQGAAEQLMTLCSSLVGVGPGNSFAAKCQNAQQDLSAGNLNGAVGILRALINEVEAQSGKKVSVSETNQVIAATQQIINVIE